MLRLLSLVGLAVGLALGNDKLNTDGPQPQLRPDEILTVQQVNAMAKAAAGSSCQVKNVDVMFVIDESGSVQRANWPAVQAFIQNLVNQFVLTGPEKAQVGMILFDYYAHLQWDFNAFAGDPEGLANEIGRLPFSGGGTQIAPAMNLAISRFQQRYGSRSSVDKVIIVMTDGQDHTDVAAARALAFRSGIDKILAIGVGRKVSVPELDQVTGDHSLVFNVTGGYGDLSKVLGAVCNATSDPCDDVDCNKRGTCLVRSNGQHYCACDEPDKWEGMDCEIRKGNLCNSEPCGNGGTCVELIPGVRYACHCLPGFSGPNCLGGKCNGHGKFRCDCPPGYTGPACEHIIDFCNSTNVLHNGAEESLKVCSGHGTCSFNASVGSHCKCDPGWTGIRCDVIVDDCSSSPCLNGGTCYNNDHQPGYYCQCPQAFQGKNCQDEPDFCHLQVPDPSTGHMTTLDLCGEHGTCSVTPAGGANCTCDAGFEGKWCRTRSQSSCVYTNSKGEPHTYPHSSTWIDDCNQCRCEYGVYHCSASLWCPHKCAVYATTQTDAQNLTVGCPPKQNCIPDDPKCAANSFGGAHPGGNPRCDYPSGWCFPTGHVMVDELSFPTNNPNGFQPFTGSW